MRPATRGGLPVGDPDPTRTAAIILLRQKGFPPQVLDALRAMSFKGSEDFSIQDFIDEARRS